MTVFKNQECPNCEHVTDFVEVEKDILECQNCGFKIEISKTWRKREEELSLVE